MNRKSSAITLLIISAMLVLALSVPLRSFANRSARANIFESIQRQLDEVLAAVRRIQIRLAELTQEEAAQDEVPAPVVETPPMAAVSETNISTTTPAQTVESSEPVWKYMPVPTTFLANGLVILYRFSITAGPTDMIVPSVSYKITYADVSIKDLEVHAFTDDIFSQKAYEINPVGRRRGFVQNSDPLSIDISDKTKSLSIPAGMIRYFELQGLTSGKNVSASAIVSAEGMQEARFE